MDDTRSARGPGTVPGSIGGNLALDFANTANWVESEAVDDWLKGYIDLTSWARSQDIIHDETERELRGKALETPHLADEALHFAREVRREIRRVFSSIASLDELPASSFEAFNEVLADLRLRVVQAKDVILLDWQIGADDLRSVLRPIVWEATELLTSEAVSRVKMCPGDRCGWLFVDSSRRRNRRWCDMRDCGNRAKARRHYQRHRVSESEIR